MKAAMKVKTWAVPAMLAAAYIGPGISYGKLYLFHPLLLLAAAVLLAIPRQRKELQAAMLRPSATWYVVPLLLISTAWFALSLLWAGNTNYGARYIVFLLMGFGLVAMMQTYVNSGERLHAVVRVLCLVFLTEMSVGLLEALTPFRWPVSRYSAVAGLFGRANDYAFLSEDPYARAFVDASPTGFAWNSNNFSVTISLFFPFFLLLRNRWLAVTGMLSILFLILMAGSRISFLTCAFVSLLAIPLAGRWVRRRAMMIFFSVIMLSTGFFTLQPTGIAKVDEIYIVRSDASIFDRRFRIRSEYSRATRLELFRDGWSALAGSRGIGIGGGNFQHYRESRAAPGEKVVASLHNFWFEVMVEGGVAYALLYYGWWLMLLSALRRRLKACADTHLAYITQGALLSMLVFGISAISLSGAVYYLPMYLLLGFVLSVLKVHALTNENSPAVGR